MNIFNFFKKKKINVGVTVIETGFTYVKFNTGDSVIGNLLKGPSSAPIKINSPKTLPVKWYQFWRYKDRKKRKEEIKEIYNTIFK